MGAQDEVVEALARERWRPLVGYAFVLTGAISEAEDLVQEALVKMVLRGRDGIDLHAAEAYARSSILSTFLDGHRRRRRWGRVRHLVAVPTADPPERDPARLASAQVDVREALLELSPRQRACIVLRHLDDRSVAETADALGVSEGAVKRYTSEAMTHLEALLGPLDTADDVTTIERTAGR